MKKLTSKLILLGGGLGLLLFTLILIGINSYNSRIEKTNALVKNPKSYNELYRLMEGINKNQDNIAYQNPTGEKDSSTSGFSKTNVQVAGVDEADIVKTDGDYIYVLGLDYLYIVDANDKDMEVVSKIKSQETIDGVSSNFIEMYINDNKLIVIKGTYQNYLYDNMEKMPSFYYGGSQETSIAIYNIADKKDPVKINELSQSGSYISSRMINNYLYVTTNHYVYNDLIENDYKTFVPSIKGEESKPIAINDILILPNPITNAYLTVTGIDINNSNDFKSSKAVFGSSSNIYANLDNLYIAGYGNEQINDTYVSKTSLIKFSMNNGMVELKATGSVNGNILNQFSMDEYDNHFRIVTTTSDFTIQKDGLDDTVTNNDTNLSKNNLFVLDTDLKVVSKLEGLAKGERIYSVRFDAEIAYFVTFKQVDPLFVVDISNPLEPTIISELKIPGFSEYLHVFDDKYLFGLGKEADADGKVTGLKISMFDIQNKSEVTEKYKLIIGDQNSWSESSYNHKSILISKDKNIIAFPVNDYYVAYRFIDNVGFEKIGEINFDSGEDMYFYGNIRGLYINDYLYVTNLSKILSLNLNTLEKGTTLDLFIPEEIEKNIGETEPSDGVQ